MWLHGEGIIEDTTRNPRGVGIDQCQRFVEGKLQTGTGGVGSYSPRSLESMKIFGHLTVILCTEFCRFTKGSDPMIDEAERTNGVLEFCLLRAVMIA